MSFCTLVILSLVECTGAKRETKEKEIEERDKEKKDRDKEKTTRERKK